MQTSSLTSLLRAAAVAVLFAFSGTAYAQDSAKPSLQPRSTLTEQLVFAASVGTADEVKELLASGANPGFAFNSNGTAALSLAAQRSDAPAAEVINALVAGGAKLEIEDKNGQTPIFYAARGGNAEAVNALLALGADYNHLDKNGDTARTIAYREHHEKLVQTFDDFATAKAADIARQYEERNKQLAERGKELEQRQQQQRMTPAPIRELPVPAHDPLEKAEIIELNKLMRDASYHTCAAEYWEFCRANRQETDYPLAELKEQIEAHRTLADEAVEAMQEDYGATQSYINRVLQPSVKQIIEELKKPYLTNAHRRAEGIGSKADMDERCTAIADQWQLVDKRKAGKKRK